MVKYLFLGLFSFSVFSNTCNIYKDSMDQLQVKIANLEQETSTLEKDLTDLSQLVDTLIEEVNETGKGTYIAVTVGSGIISIATAYLTVRMVRSSEVGGVSTLGKIVPMISILTGARSFVGTRKYFVSRSQLKKAKKKSGQIQKELSKQKNLIINNKKQLDRVQKKYNSLGC